MSDDVLNVQQGKILVNLMTILYTLYTFYTLYTLYTSYTLYTLYMTPARDPNQWKISNLFVTCLKASLKPICDAFETYLELSCYLTKANLKAA